MAKQELIDIGGEEVLVREDTAKSYRGVMWFLGTILIILGIMAVLFFGGFIYSVSDGELERPETRIGTPAN